jgi:tetratricopeptide (TPR) repeat protein
VTSTCPSGQFEDKLHAYELGLLSEDETREFEQHLMECPACFERASKLEQAIKLINSDPEIKKLLAKIDSTVTDNAHDAEPISRPSRISITRLIPFAAAALILLTLILKPWQITISPNLEAFASERRLAVIPFDYLNDSTDSLATGAMIANLLTADLSGSKFIQVVSQRRIEAIYRQSQDSNLVPPTSGMQATSIADKTGARYTLSGTITRTDTATIVSAQLYDMEHTSIITSVQVAGKPQESLFPLVDKLSVMIRAALDLPDAARHESDPSVADITTKSARAYYHYVKGEDLASQFRMEEASGEYHQALTLDSTFAMAWYGLWSATTRSEYIDQALKYADNVGHKERQMIQIAKAQSARDYLKAAAECHALLNEYPFDAEALFTLGYLYYYTGAFDSSLIYLNQCIAADPMYKTAYNLAAYAYDFTGNLDSALDMIDKYIAIAPDEPNPYDSKGEILSNNGRLEDALVAYRQSVELAPDFYPTLWKIGNVLMFQQKFDSAYAVYQSTLSVESREGRGIGRLYLSYPLIHQGRLSEALSLLDDAIGADRLENRPTDEAYKHLAKAHIYEETKRLPQALNEARLATEAWDRLNADSTRVCWVYYGLILARSGQFDDAAQIAYTFREHALEHQSYATLAIESAIAMTRGRANEAITKIERAASMTEAYEAKYLRAKSLFDVGLFEQAAGALDSLNQDYSDMRAMFGLWSSKSFYYAGIAYESLGQTKTAIARYHAFLQIWDKADPELPELADTRERLHRLTSNS